MDNLIYHSAEDVTLSAEKIVYPDGTAVLLVTVGGACSGATTFSVLPDDLPEIADRFRAIKDDPTPDAQAKSIGQMMDAVREVVSVAHEDAFMLARHLVRQGWTLGEVPVG